MPIGNDAQINNAEMWAQACQPMRCTLQLALRVERLRQKGRTLGNPADNSSKLLPIRRLLRKCCGQFAKVHPIPPLKPRLANPMLLRMVRYTQTYCPPIGRLQPDPPVCPAPDVRTFNRNLATPRHAAVVPPNPRAVGRTGSRIRFLAGAIDPLREKPAKHRPSPEPWPEVWWPASQLARWQARDPCPDQ